MKYDWCSSTLKFQYLQELPPDPVFNVLIKKHISLGKHTLKYFHNCISIKWVSLAALYILFYTLKNVILRWGPQASPVYNTKRFINFVLENGGAMGRKTTHKPVKCTMSESPFQTFEFPASTSEKYLPTVLTHGPCGLVSYCSLAYLRSQLTTSVCNFLQQWQAS